MNPNANQRDGQLHASGAHPALRPTAEQALEQLGVVMLHGGDHPGTKPPAADRDRARAARKRQKHARKKNRKT